MTRSPRRLLWSIPILALAVCGAAAISPDGQARSVWIGVYSGAQARNGEALYLEHCAQCHGANLAGVEQAPALAGGAFGEKWKGATLKTLFDRVASMPPTRPNSLSAPQSADVLAYLLSAAGLPSGTTMLSADRSALDELVFSPTLTSTQMTESAPAPAPVRTARAGRRMTLHHRPSSGGRMAATSRACATRRSIRSTGTTSPGCRSPGG